MEFAGRTIPEDAEQKARDLYDRLAQADDISDYPEDAEELKTTILNLATENLDVTTALFMQSIESRSVVFRTMLAPKLAMYCRQVNPEIGNRLLHVLLTSGEPGMRNGAISEIRTSYDKGKLSYDEYMPFYTTFELETARDARYRIQ
jgi:hypothetical protein